MTSQRHKPIQDEFLSWIEDGSYEHGINPTVPVVNWLYHTMATKNLKWSSVLNKKSAVLALFKNADEIRKDPVFKAFMDAGASNEIVDTKHHQYTVDPVLAMFRQAPSNMEIPMVDLARKLCWLLGVCGFMRPDDIKCTDVARSSILKDKLQLAVVFPKERRGKQRIIKYVHLSKHNDPAVCVVEAYHAYRARTLAMDLPIAHPKDPNYTIVPLIRNSTALVKPVTSTTISVYMNTVSRLMVPKNGTLPKLRALGSTLAALAGVPIPDIMVQGNWSSPKIFEKHYRLASITATNISTSTLG